jgi:hypothetical protein
MFEGVGKVSIIDPLSRTCEPDCEPPSPPVTTDVKRLFNEDLKGEVIDAKLTPLACPFCIVSLTSTTRGVGVGVGGETVAFVFVFVFAAPAATDIWVGVINCSIGGVILATPGSGEINSDLAYGEKGTGSARVGGGAERLFMELIREPKDRSTVLMVLLVAGAGDKVNEANVGSGETSKSGGLVIVDDWSKNCCCPGEPRKPDPEGESKFVLFCFLLNSLLNKLRLPDAGPGAGEAGGDIIAMDMDVRDAGGTGGIGVGLLFELELELDW